MIVEKEKHMVAVAINVFLTIVCHEISFIDTPKWFFEVSQEDKVGK